MDFGEEDSHIITIKNVSLKTYSRNFTNKFLICYGFSLDNCTRFTSKTELIKNFNYRKVPVLKSCARLMVVYIVSKINRLKF